MDLLSEIGGDEAKALASTAAPFGPGFDKEEVDKTERLTVHGSAIDDPGPDFTEFSAYDASGKLLARRRLGGY